MSGTDLLSLLRVLKDMKDDIRDLAKSLTKSDFKELVKVLKKLSKDENIKLMKEAVKELKRFNDNVEEVKSVVDTNEIKEFKEDIKSMIDDVKALKDT